MDRHTSRSAIDIVLNLIANIVIAGMMCVGENPESNLVEVVEIPALKWFVGVQFHPEYNSTVVNPNPLFVSFVKAAVENKK